MRNWPDVQATGAGAAEDVEVDELVVAAVEVRGAVVAADDRDPVLDAAAVCSPPAPPP
jgi:hypothetical protein